MFELDLNENMINAVKYPCKSTGTDMYCCATEIMCYTAPQCNTK